MSAVWLSRIHLRVRERSRFSSRSWACASTQPAVLSQPRAGTLKVCPQRYLPMSYQHLEHLRRQRFRPRDGVFGR